MTALLPPLRLTGATILRDGEMQRRSLVVADGRITKGPLPELDLSGYLILPGIVDLFGEAIERHVAPRPGDTVPALEALRATDREAASHGVTTAWVAQGWSWEGGHRGPEAAERMMAALDGYKTQSLTDLRLLLRCETRMPWTRAQMIAALRRHRIDAVLFSDRLATLPDPLDTVAIDLALLAARCGTGPEALRAAAGAAKACAREVPRHLCQLAETFDAEGIRYGSLADPNGETREYFRIIGARIAAFPGPAAAKLARACNDPVVLGAPDLLRRTGSGPALHIAALGHCDALASHFHYPSLPRAAWDLVDRRLRSLPEAWAMISSTPAEIMGLADRGTLDYGKRADFTVLNAATREVEATVCGGKLSYLAGQAGARLVGAMAGINLAAE